MMTTPNMYSNLQASIPGKVILSFAIFLGYRRRHTAVLIETSNVLFGTASCRDSIGMNGNSLKERRVFSLGSAPHIEQSEKQEKQDEEMKKI